MIEVLVRPEAEADIESITDYTIERWGVKQAQRYVQALRADIASLEEFPERFPAHEPTRLGLRRMRSGHHLVFYLVGEQAVEIVRILHQRQDVSDEIDDF